MSTENVHNAYSLPDNV